MLAENSLFRKTQFNDALFLKKLHTVTTEQEIQEIIKLIDEPEYDFMTQQKIELFFHKIKGGFETWYETVLGLMEHYDFDLMGILSKTHLLEKLKAEKRVNKNVDMSELFE